MKNYYQLKLRTKKEKILPQLLKLRKVTNNKKLIFRNIKGEYNCWGFTAYSFNWIQELIWFDFPEMEYCLEMYTRRVNKPKTGDIVVYRDEFGDLLHTAILTDENKHTILHKPGYLELEVNTIGGSSKIYYEAEEIYYMRPLKNKKFSYKKFNKSKYAEEYDNYF